MAGKPHVSAAIVQLRRWISAAAAVLCLCLGAQLLIFGFVHYTDVRWTTIKAEPKDRPLMVVEGPAEAAASGGGPVRVSAQEARAKSVREAALGESHAADLNMDINRVLTGVDRVMRVGCELATTFGIIAVISLVVLTCLGVVVAGGGAVPGVEKAVTACAWSCILAGICMPLRDALPSLPFPGVLAGYDSMVVASEAASAGRRGEGGLLGLYVVLPALALACSALVRIWFNEGVERGVIYTSVSEIDEAMDKEMASISARGVQAGVPRAMGALHRAIGDPAVTRDEPPVRLAAGAEGLSDPHAPRSIRRQAIDPDEFKRPI